MSELLKQLMAQQDAFLNQTRGTSQAAAELHAEIRQDQGEQETRAKVVSEINIAKTALEAAAALQTAEENRAAAKAFGVNMDDPENVVVQTATIAREAVRKANTEVQKAEAKRNKPFGEDILGSIAAMFTIPIHEKTAVEETGVAASATQRLNQLNQAAQTQFRTNEAMKREVTQASVLNRVEEAVAKGAEAVAVLKQNNMRSNITDLIQVLSLNREGLAVLQQQYSNQLQAEQIARATEMYGLQRQEHELKLRQNKATEEEQRVFVDTVNAGRAVYNLPPMTLAEVNSYMRTGGKAKALMDQWYDSGALKKSTGISHIANNPAAAMVLFDQAGVRFPPGDPRGALQEFIELSAKQYKETLQGKAATKPEEILTGVNSAALENAKQAHRLIKPGDASNIYGALPFASLVKSKTVQETPLYGAVLKAQEDAGIVDLPPERIFEQAAAAVATKKLTLEQAADSIADYAAVIMAYNNTYKNYRSVGLPSQTGYFTTVPAGDNLGRKVTVNLFDVTQVKAALMRNAGNRTDPFNVLFNTITGKQ
jgi:hypothetical protein